MNDDNMPEALKILRAKHNYQRAELALTQTIDLLNYAKEHPNPSLSTQNAVLSALRQDVQNREDARDAAMTKYIAMGGELDF